MEVGGIILYLLAFIIILGVARELACWYFKVNETLKHIEKISKLLESIDGKMSSQGGLKKDG